MLIERPLAAAGLPEPGQAETGHRLPGRLLPFAALLEAGAGHLSMSAWLSLRTEHGRSHGPISAAVRPVVLIGSVPPVCSQWSAVDIPYETAQGSLLLSLCCPHLPPIPPAVRAIGRSIFPAQALHCRSHCRYRTASLFPASPPVPGQPESTPRLWK